MGLRRRESWRRAEHALHTVSPIYGFFINPLEERHV